MKRWILSAAFLALFSAGAFSLPAEESCWSNILFGNYRAAGELAKGLGESDGAYYGVAYVCYALTDDYLSCYLTKTAFRPGESVKKFESMLLARMEKETNNASLYLFAGETRKLTSLRLPETAEAYFLKSASLNTNNPYAYNELSMSAAGRKDVSNAVRYAELAIALKPDFPEPYNNRAYAFYLQGDRDRAAETLLDCLEKCGTVPLNTFQSLTALACETGINTVAPGGRQMMVEVPLFKSDEVMERVIGLSKIQPKHFLELADYLVEHNEHAQLGETVRTMKVPAALKNLHAYVLAGTAYLEGDDQGLLAQAEVLAASDFTDYHRLFSLGNRLFQSEENEAALRVYLKALSNTSPLDREYRMQLFSNIGAVYLAQKNYSRSLDYMKKALELEPEDTITLVNLGIASLRQNDKVRAREYFERAKKSTGDPGYLTEISNWLKKTE